jgi:hypothetical protein
MRSLKLTETVDRLSRQGDAQFTENPWLSASEPSLAICQAALAHTY